MDIKKELLLYLYENKGSGLRLPINKIFRDINIPSYNIRLLLNDLSLNGIVSLNNRDYLELGSTKMGKEVTIDGLDIKASLTYNIGVPYVEENYIKSNSEQKNIISLSDMSHDTDFYHSRPTLDLPEIKPNITPKVEARQSKIKSIGILNEIVKHPVISGIIVIFLAWLIYEVYKMHFHSFLGIPIE